MRPQEPYRDLTAAYMTPEDFAVLRHIALNLLRQQQTKRLSLKAKRLKAGWDTDYLLQVLQGI